MGAQSRLVCELLFIDLYTSRVVGRLVLRKKEMKKKKKITVRADFYIYL